MDKYIYDEKNGLWYELQGDYYLPCLKLPEEVEVHIGAWGQHHRRYLKEHRKIAYTRLLTSGKLNRYLADIDHQAEELRPQHRVRRTARAQRDSPRSGTAFFQFGSRKNSRSPDADPP